METYHKTQLGNNKTDDVMIVIITVLCLNTLYLSLKPMLPSAYNTDLISTLMTFFLAFIPAFFLLKLHKISLVEHGLVATHWKKNLLESSAVTLVLLVLMTLIKLLLITHVPRFHSIALFNGRLAHLNHSAIILAIIYSLSCPLQEFIARGILQTTLQKFLHYRHTLVAVIISNLIYSTLHTFESFYYAVATFFLGLFWSWMYTKQQSIIGCALSHALIGVWGIFILGVHEIITVKYIYIPL